VSDLPAEGKYPVFYPFTGVGYALSAEQQKLWQDDVKRFEEKLIALLQSNAARRKPGVPTSPLVKPFLAHNSYLETLK
jgi:hypothetical protein